MIYIVEDDDSIRELEEYVLRSAGFTVQGFTNARDFWAACAQQPPRLAVLDIMLPDEDGMSILHKLRADPATRALPVMLVSAKGAELDRVRGLEDGADDYLAKPFGVMEFSARIKALLRRKRMEKAAGLLSRTRLPVGDVIAMVGYENTSYFHRTFSEMYGMTPREYRLRQSG